MLGGDDMIIFVVCCGVFIAVIVLNVILYRIKRREACIKGEELPCLVCRYGRYFDGDYGSRRWCVHPSCPPGAELGSRNDLWSWPKRMMTDTETGERVWLDRNGGYKEYEESPRSRFIDHRRECPHFQLKGRHGTS